MAGISSGVSAMAAAEKRLDGLAHNLANVSTTAFKRRASFVHALDAKRPDELHVGMRIDFRQGELVRTEAPLDLALEGEGFFVVETRAGEVYTRDGSFRVAEGGALVTMNGDPVAWEQLTGAIDPTGEPVFVDVGGSVRQGAVSIGNLRIVDFAEKQRLSQDDGGRFRAPLELRQIAHTARVHQGALESSNVSPIEEMVEMVAAQRAFGSATNVLALIQDTYRRLSRM